MYMYIHVLLLLLFIYLFILYCSPQIRAASEKLSELKDQPKGSTTPTFRSVTPNKMPGGNAEVLEAQKKRFEDLKVRTLPCSWALIRKYRCGWALIGNYTCRWALIRKYRCRWALIRTLLFRNVLQRKT